jgi:hypothetical protein
MISESTFQECNVKKCEEEGVGEGKSQLQKNGLFFARSLLKTLVRFLEMFKVLDFSKMKSFFKSKLIAFDVWKKNVFGD